MIDKRLELLTPEELAKYNNLKKQREEFFTQYMNPAVTRLEVAIKNHNQEEQDKITNQIIEKSKEYGGGISKEIRDFQNFISLKYAKSFAPGVHSEKNPQNYKRLMNDAKECLQALTLEDYENFKKNEFFQRGRALSLNDTIGKPQAGWLTESLFALNAIYHQLRVNQYYDSCCDIDLIKLATDMVSKLLKVNIEPTKTTINKAKAIIESKQQEKYGKILQNTGLNALTKIDTKKQKVDYNPLSKIGTITKGDFTLTMKNYMSIEGFTATTHQLLDTLFLQYCETKTDDRGFVNLPLKTYMELRGLRDEKTAREQVNRELETLYSASISFTDKKVKQTYTDKKGNTKTTRKPRNYLDVRIIQEKGLRNSIISVMFSDRFNKEVLPNLHLMDYPKELLTINSKHNPNSYYLGRKIAELKRMNAGNKNEDLISVKTLLESCPTIPTYEEVMENMGQKLNEKIIAPFDRDMDNLSSMLGWHYCHSNGALLTDEELATLDYDLFITLLVKIEWWNYPDQKERVEKKRKQKQAATTRINNAIAKERAKQALKNEKSPK